MVFAPASAGYDVEASFDLALADLAFGHAVRARDLERRPWRKHPEPALELDGVRDGVERSSHADVGVEDELFVGLGYDPDDEPRILPRSDGGEFPDRHDLELAREVHRHGSRLCLPAVVEDQRDLALLVSIQAARLEGAVEVRSVGLEARLGGIESFRHEFDGRIVVLLLLKVRQSQQSLSLPDLASEHSEVLDGAFSCYRDVQVLPVRILD